MKRFGFAIAAVFAAAMFAAPLAAAAQSYGGGGGSSVSGSAPEPAGKAAKLPPYGSEQLDRGKKEAPPVAAASGVTCAITSAAYVGTSTSKDEKGKELKQNIYEVSCKEGLGYAFIAQPEGPPKMFDCLALVGNPNLSCRLPENADPKKGLQPAVAQTGSQCTIANARYLGSKPSGETFYEVGCGATPGFVLETIKGQPPKAIGCDEVGGGNLACKFTTQAQLDAIASEKAGALLAKSGKTCQMTKARTIGHLETGDYAYEVACQDGTGYILEAQTSGAFDKAISCAVTPDSCKLSDATKAESAETGTYTRLAKAGGFQCDVSKYRFIGMQDKNEVVELQCANRPDGTVAVFPSDSKSPAKFMDCITVGALGQECKLTSPTVLYAKYTQALVSKGKKSCTVSGAHWLATTQTGDNYIETACSDGLPGWVIVMSPAGTASELRTCGEIKSSVACTLPGNTK